MLFQRFSESCDAAILNMKELTESQKDVIEWLAHILHEMQQLSLKEFWNGSNGSYYTILLNGIISNKLEKADLPPISLVSIVNEREFSELYPKEFEQTDKVDCLFRQVLIPKGRKESRKYLGAKNECMKCVDEDMYRIEYYLYQIDIEYDECYAPHSPSYYRKQEIEKNESATICFCG